MNLENGILKMALKMSKMILRKRLFILVVGCFSLRGLVDPIIFNPGGGTVSSKDLFAYESLNEISRMLKEYNTLNNFIPNGKSWSYMSNEYFRDDFSGYKKIEKRYQETQKKLENFLNNIGNRFDMIEQFTYRPYKSIWTNYKNNYQYDDVFKEDLLSNFHDSDFYKRNNCIGEKNCSTQSDDHSKLQEIAINSWLEYLKLEEKQFEDDLKNEKELIADSQQSSFYNKNGIGASFDYDNQFIEKKVNKYIKIRQSLMVQEQMLALKRKVDFEEFMKKEIADKKFLKTNYETSSSKSWSFNNKVY